MTLSTSLGAAKAAVKNSPFNKKYKKLNEEFCSIIEDFGLVSFIPLDITSSESVGLVLANIDKSNGYVYGLSEMKEYERSGGEGEGSLSHLFKCAAIAERGGLMHDTIHDISEKYLGGKVFKEKMDFEGFEKEGEGEGEK